MREALKSIEKYKEVERSREKHSPRERQRCEPCQLKRHDDHPGGGGEPTPLRYHYDEEDGDEGSLSSSFIVPFTITQMAIQLLVQLVLLMQTAVVQKSKDQINDVFNIN